MNIIYRQDLSVNHDDEDLCHKIMRLIKVDEDTGLRILKILLLNPKQKKRNLAYPVSYPKIDQWRDRNASKQQQMREEMRELGVPKRDVERVLHYMFDAKNHVFPEDMHQAVDKFHKDQGWADYMQCNAKCTACDVPCCTSAEFGKCEELEPPPMLRTRIEHANEMNRLIKHPLFYEKLMQALKIDIVTAKRLLDTMGLKYSVTWENMKEIDFGKHWWAYSWDQQNDNKYKYIRDKLLSTNQTNILEDLLQENVHRFEDFIPRRPLGVEFNHHNMVPGNILQPKQKNHNHHGRKKSYGKHKLPPKGRTNTPKDSK